jgi:hypothetical protein
MMLLASIMAKRGSMLDTRSADFGPNQEKKYGSEERIRKAMVVKWKSCLEKPSP